MFRKKPTHTPRMSNSVRGRLVASDAIEFDATIGKSNVMRQIEDVSGCDASRYIARCEYPYYELRRTRRKTHFVRKRVTRWGCGVKANRI